MSRSSRPFWLGQDRRKWDHIRIHLEVVKDKRIGPYHFAVYAGLTVHAEAETGDAYPAAETLGSYFGISERTVRRYIADLEEWGLVEVVPRPGQASIYRVLPPKSADSQSGVEKMTPESGDARPRTLVPDTPDSPSDEQEPRTRTKNESRARAFETFWQTYPKRHGRRVGKAQAEKYWKKLKPADQALAIKGAEVLAAAVVRNETWAPDPWRWLRDRAFEEWAEFASPSLSGPTGVVAPPLECKHGYTLKAHCEECEAEGIPQDQRRAV